MLCFFTEKKAGIKTLRVYGRPLRDPAILAALAVLLLLIAFAREQGARDAKAWEAWKAGPGRVESKPQREAGPDLFLMLRDCASEGSLTEWVRHLPWEQHSPEWGVAALVDCETTGLYHQDELIELAVILFYFDRTTAAVHGIADWYVGWREPAVEIDPDATKKNGITRDMVAGKMLDSRRVDAIFDRAEFFIAHNAGFDSRFVSQVFPRVKRKRWLCSLYDVNWKRCGMQRRSLEYLLVAHRIRRPKAHRALADAAATLTLLQQSGRDGRTTWRSCFSRRAFVGNR